MKIQVVKKANGKSGLPIRARVSSNIRRGGEEVTATTT